MIELQGGLLANPDALALGVALEARGHRLQVASNGKLLVYNSAALTPADVAAITTHLRQLQALTAYRAPEAP